MHRHDIIGWSCVAFSVVCSALTQAIDAPWWIALVVVAWSLPLIFWLIPQAWKQHTPPCTLRQWRDMRRLGYSWSWMAREFTHRRTYEDYDYVRYRDGLWQFLSYREVGTDAMFKETTPVDSPITAHVLGQLSQEPYTW